MATATADYRVKEVPNPHVPARGEEDEDFVLIDFIMESTDGKPSPRRQPQTSSGGPTPAVVKQQQDEYDEEYDDYVELTMEDANLPESEKTKKSFYGIRLFQYSAESEGNIYITNEEL